MSKARFVYRGKDRTVESVSRRAQSNRSYDSIIKPEFQQLKVKEGELALRILPDTWEDRERWGDSWEIVVWNHFSIGPDGGAYLCIDKMLGQPCPVCEARMESTNEDERDALRPGERRLAWVIDRHQEKAGPQIWNFGVKIVKEIVARGVDKRTNTPIFFDDPENGYDLMFNREGKEKDNTSYTGVEFDREPSPIHQNEALQDRWLDYIQDHPLPDTLQFYDYDYIKKVMSGRAKPKAQEEVIEESRPRNRLARVEDYGTEETTSRRSGHREEPVDESETSSRRSRQVENHDVDPPFETDEKPSRSNGRRNGSEQPEEAIKSEERSSRPERRNVTGEAPTPPSEPPEQQARRGLERLRSRATRG